MAYLEFTSDLVLGIQVLDDQHRGLVDMANRLHDKADADGGAVPNDARDCLREMMRYAVEHFRTEEGLMEQAGWSELGEHRKEHEGFIDQVQRLDYHLGQGVNKTSEILDFLASWLTRHIMNTDRRFVRRAGL